MDRRHHGDRGNVETAEDSTGSYLGIIDYRTQLFTKSPSHYSGINCLVTIFPWKLFISNLKRVYFTCGKCDDARLLQVFEKCLVNLQRENFLTEVENQRLFSNINEVFEANLTFWQEYLKQVVEEARSTKKPIKPSQLLDSFAKVRILYTSFLREVRVFFGQ